MKTSELTGAAPYMKCGNKLEFQQRLQWLSEGMLRNHMDSVRDYVPDQEEIKLYRQHKELK